MDAHRGRRRSGTGTERLLRSCALGLAILLLAAPGPAAARHRHAAGHRWSDGVVRCAALSVPSRRHVEARRDGLPTDRAVFFARSGDRCLWRHGATGRG